jgi:replicative DNA helicase
MMEKKLSEKLPPHNIEAEQAVLGAMLLDNACIPEVQKIITDDSSFYAEIHRKIFLAIMEASKNNGQVDNIILADRLNQLKQLDEVGGRLYLSRLVDNVASAANVGHYAKIIKHTAILRQTISGYADIINMAYDGSQSLEDILGQSQNLLTDLMKQSADDNPIEMLKTPLKDLLNYFANCREMPWSSLNEALGGLFDGELTVVGGLPGVGKSTFAHGLMRNVTIEENRPVVYFGPQMSPQKVQVRQLAAMCRIPENDIKRGRIKEEQLEALEAATQKINAAEIYREIVGERVSAHTLMTYVRKVTDHAKKPMGLVIVENLQQITYPGKKPGKDTADEVLSALRSFGIEMKIPVYISSQLNESEGGERRPTIGDLRSTGNTKEIADKILLLHRPGYHPKDKTFKKSEPGEVIIVKGGPPIVLPFTFFGSCFYWEEEETKEE